MNTQTKNNNLEELINMGYDIATSQKYLDLCDNNLEKALDLLLTNTEIKTDIDINTDILLNSINNKKYSADQSVFITKLLNRYSDDQHEIKNALDKSNGNFQHAKIILNKENLLTDSDTGPDSD